MKMHLLKPVILACTLGLGATCFTQDLTPPAGQGQGRGGRGMGGMLTQGRGVMGTVTQVTPDHFVVKNASGEEWTVHYSVNTRMMKQPARASGQRDAEQGRGMGRGNPPQPIQPTDIKVGDAIGAGGEVDEQARSVGAVFVMLLDPERAREMEQMRANFGKTWLMGRVTAISEAKVTLHSGVDSADHMFVADENTTFRKQREPITLGDIGVGDNVRVEGSIKGGEFVATSVTVMGPPMRGGPVKRPGDQAPQ